MTAEEQKRQKAKALRYKKPIVKDLNLETIQEELWEIQEACTDVQWYYDTDEDTLINALDGDEDEAQEFKMMFADLCAECERMAADLEEEYVPDCFNDLFVAAGAGEYAGGLLGWDAYEGDYFGIGCPPSWAEEESTKRIFRMTKKELIDATRACLRVLYSYIGLRHRYDCLKAALDILRDENTGYLQLVKQIEETYERAAADGFYSWYGSTRDFDRLLENLPPEAWVQ